MLCYSLYKGCNCITLFILMESNALSNFCGTSSLSRSVAYIWGDIYLKKNCKYISFLRVFTQTYAKGAFPDFFKEP